MLRRGFSIAPMAGGPLAALIAGLQADGSSAQLDRLGVFAQPTQTLAKVDVITGATVTLNNAPTFTANRGFTGDALAAWINTNFNPSSGSPLYSLNAADIGVFLFSGPSAGLKQQIANGDSEIFINSGTTSYTLNASTDATWSNGGTITGFFHAQRTASNAQALYVNGVQSSTSPAATTAISNAAFALLSSAGGASLFSDAGISVAFIGNGISPLPFYNRIRTYLTAVGVP